MFINIYVDHSTMIDEKKNKICIKIYLAFLQPPSILQLQILSLFIANFAYHIIGLYILQKYESTNLNLSQIIVSDDFKSNRNTTEHYFFYDKNQHIYTLTTYS